jgi:ribosomal protein S18 acetylase RimI-like enzyme
MPVADSHLHRLEEIFLNSMTPPEQLLYDGWLVRFARGDVRRSRSVNILNPSRLPLEDKLDYCTMLYGEKQMTPVYRLTSLGVEPELEALLAKRDYARHSESIVMAMRLEAPLGAEPEGMRFEAVDSEGFSRFCAALQDWPDEVRTAFARRLRFSPMPQHRLVAYSEDDDVVGTAMSMREDDWVGLFNVYVEPSQRGKGIATALCSYLLEQGRQWGSARAWLAVEADNEAAVRLYRGIGFEEAYRYWYREAPAS